MQSHHGAECADCHQRFVNRGELEEHRAMVHDAKWHGNINQSENGDLNANGAVPPTTEDHLRTHGNVDRPSAEQRAARMQGRI